MDFLAFLFNLTHQGEINEFSHAVSLSSGNELNEVCVYSQLVHAAVVELHLCAN